MIFNFIFLKPAKVDYIAFLPHLQVKSGLFALIGQNFFLYRFGHLLISFKEHGIVSTALRSGSQIRCISEHLSQRDKSADHLSSADIVHTLDTSAAGVDIADNVSQDVYKRQVLRSGG